MLLGIFTARGHRRRRQGLRGLQVGDGLGQVQVQQVAGAFGGRVAQNEDGDFDPGGPELRPLVHAGHGGGPAHGLVPGVRPHGADVFPHGLGEQERLLEHQADLTAQGFPLHAADVHPADGDGAAAGFPDFLRHLFDAGDGPAADAAAVFLHPLHRGVEFLHIGDGDIELLILIQRIVGIPGGLHHPPVRSGQFVYRGDLGQQILDVLRRTCWHTAPFSESLPDLRAVCCGLRLF